MASGRWADAEREFEAALDEFRGLAETDPLSGLAGLAQLRIRQGRPEEAAQLLAGSEDRPGAVEGMVSLHLARGEVELAAAAARAAARGRRRRRCLQRPAVRPPGGPSSSRADEPTTPNRLPMHSSD